MTIQTLIFSGMSVASAKAWAKRHGFRYGKVDVTSASVRLRQRDPREFAPNSFRTIPLRDGVQAVVGRPVAVRSGALGVVRENPKWPQDSREDWVRGGGTRGDDETLWVVRVLDWNGKETDYINAYGKKAAAAHMRDAKRTYEKVWKVPAKMTDAGIVALDKLPKANPYKPFKFHEHPRMSFRNRETGEAPTLAEWAEMVARAHQIIDDYRYRSPEQLEWAAKVDPAYYADVVVLAAYNAPSKKNPARTSRANPDPERARLLEPLFGAGRKLVRAVNRGAGPDVEGALLARARAAAREADARGLPGSRILRAMLKEMKSRQTGFWRNPIAVPVGQGLIINSPKRR